MGLREKLDSITTLIIKSPLQPSEITTFNYFVNFF